MTPLRVLAIAALLVAPTLVLAGIGSWMIWVEGRFVWLWWLLPICWITALLLAMRWRKRRASVRPIPLRTPDYWTPRDRQALELVEQQQKEITEIDPARLTDPHFYLDTAVDLAHRVSRIYHPKAEDPISPLTVPEILAAANLAIQDLERWCQAYVPAGHLLTIGQWRRLANAPTWLRNVRDVSWVLSTVLRPSNLGRVVLSRLAMDRTGRQLQTNLLAWFYMMYVRNVGFYLIELNSGRLRGGAERYLQLRRARQAASGRQVDGPMADWPAAQDATQEATATQSSKTAKSNVDPPSTRDGKTDHSKEKPIGPVATSESAEAGSERDTDLGAAPRDGTGTEVTLAVVGQTGAGKTSLIRALAGSHPLTLEHPPRTESIERYRLRVAPDDPASDQILLDDTPGYAAAEPPRGRRTDWIRACQRADCILLVMDATSPARAPDLEMVETLSRWFSERPHHRPPPILGVLTHIDLLKPVLEWEPPYNWQTPTGAKEQSIHDALEYTAQLFGTNLVGIIPVASDVATGRTYGIRQWLVPAMAALVRENRAAALVRAFEAEFQRNRLPMLARQIRNLGWELLKASLDAGTER